MTKMGTFRTQNHSIRIKPLPPFYPLLQATPA
jgi:hypothetical protein